MSTAAEVVELTKSLIDSSPPSDYSPHLMRVEFRESLPEVFSEVSGDEEVSALIPLNHLIGFRVFPSEGEDDRFIFSPRPFGPVSVHEHDRDDRDRLLSKSLYFSWPFSLAVRTSSLRKAIDSLRRSHGFAGVIFRILSHRKGIDLSGEGEWTVFFDLFPFEKTVLFRNPLSSDRDQRDQALAREAFSLVKRELEERKEYIDSKVKELILGKAWFDLGSPSYSPNLVFSISVFNSSFLSIQDYHPFAFQGLGFLRKIGDKFEENPETIRSITFNRYPFPLLVLEFSTYSGVRRGESLLESPDLISEVVSISSLASSLGSLDSHILEELEKVWSLPIGEGSPLGVYPARQIKVSSSNTYYWESILEIFEGIYVNRRGKSLEVFTPDQKFSPTPDFGFLTEEEFSGLVRNALHGGTNFPWYNFITSSKENSFIVFSPSLIYDYPDNVGNIRTIYLVPYISVKYPDGSEYLYFSPIASFSGRVGVSTFFLGNRVLNLDFLITYSYSKKESSLIPYITLSTAGSLKGENLEIKGKEVKSFFSDKGVNVVRDGETLCFGCSVYLKRGLPPIPGSRLTVYYLPPIAEIGHGEKIDFGWAKDFLEAIKEEASWLGKEDREPVQGELFPSKDGREVYLKMVKYFYDNELEFIDRLSSNLSGALFLIERKRQDSGNRFVDRYLIREGIKQEVFSFPLVLDDEMIRSVLSHRNYAFFRNSIWPACGEVGPPSGIYRNSSIHEEVFRYLKTVPEEVRGEAESYLSHLFKLLFSDPSAVSLSDVPPPPSKRSSFFFLISEPSFVSTFSPRLVTHGENVKEFYILELPLLTGKEGTYGPGWRNTFLPPRLLVRYMRVNDEESDFFSVIHVFHRMEVSPLHYQYHGFGSPKSKTISRMYPLNDISSLLL
jgi:hypothetical protein